MNATMKFLIDMNRKSDNYQNAMLRILGDIGVRGLPLREERCVNWFLDHVLPLLNFQDF